MSRPGRDWRRYRFTALGVALEAPSGVGCEPTPRGVRIEFPSGYVFEVAPREHVRTRHDCVEAVREWFDTTPYRTEKHVLLDEPDAFAARCLDEDEAPRVMFAAQSGTWFADATHDCGICTGPEEFEDRVRGGLSARDAARFVQLRGQLDAAVAAGDEPTAERLMRTVGRLSMKSRAPLHQEVSLTLDECSTGIALVRSIRPLSSRSS